jgi:ABC-type Fe3+-hydroxamate transport system substrate-binding protein
MNHPDFIQPPDLSRVPARVVSLVPSLTESMIELGIGERLVGATDHCPLTDSIAADVTRVGGIRDGEMEAITALKPDLVIAGREENDKSMIEDLRSVGIPVWLTFPRCVEDALKILWAMVRLFNVEQENRERLRVIETSLDWVSRASWDAPSARVFCPIWREQTDPVGTWWMTFNHDTYCHNVLRHCGGMNVFEERERRYPLLADLGQAEPEEPGERDTRYPRVLPAEVTELVPELILIPNEPYVFSKSDVDELKELLADTPAVRNHRVVPLDGRLIAWHGTRLAKALAELPIILKQ